MLKKGEARGGETWSRKVEAFNDKMMTGLDIRTFDPDRVEKLEEKYEVKMKAEDVDLWTDNCKQKSCSCSWSSVTKCKDCPSKW